MSRRCCPCGQSFRFPFGFNQVISIIPPPERVSSVSFQPPDFLYLKQRLVCRPNHEASYFHLRQDLVGGVPAVAVFHFLFMGRISIWVPVIIVIPYRYFSPNPVRASGLLAGYMYLVRAEISRDTCAQNYQCHADYVCHSIPSFLSRASSSS